MNADQMTDAEIDTLLARFDETEPSLQRRIIAQFVLDAATSETKYQLMEEAFHQTMDMLRRSRMRHGDCNSGQRYGGTPKACSACMANLRLDELLKAYKGRPIKVG